MAYRSCSECMHGRNGSCDIGCNQSADDCNYYQK